MMGMYAGSWARTQASATWEELLPISAAIFLTSAAMARLRSLTRAWFI